MKKFWLFLCLVCCLGALLLCGCGETESTLPDLPEVGGGNNAPSGGGAVHVHDLIYRAPALPVCGQPGHIEHWECTACGAYFADANGEDEMFGQRAVLLYSNEHTSGIAYSETEHWVEYTCACRLPATNYEDHDPTAVCEVCGYRPGSDGLEYTYNGNTGTYAVSGIGQAKGDVVIPTLYNGSPVTEIAAHAFASATQMTSVAIPDSIVSIGAHAFRGCSGLTEIELPGSITKIDESVFSMCEGLVRVTFLPADGGETSPITEIGQWAFRGCRSLKSIEIPPNVTTISYNAFYDCAALETVILPEKLVSIESYAFDGCVKLANIKLPAGLLNIGSNAFQGCTSLIEVENGLHYVGNWVVSGDRALVRIDAMREDTVGIAYGAFAGCSKLIYVKIAQSVCYIGAGAFEGCTGLTSAVFENPYGWYCAALASDGSGAYVGGLQTPATAAIMLTATYASRYWKCN